MKRLFPCLLCLLLLFGCGKPAQSDYQNNSFSASIPEPFESVKDSSVICFAPYGDPLLSSSITVSITELNWYFDSFTKEEYEEALKTMCGYETLSVESFETCRVGVFDARRVACSVSIDQGRHDLILYAVNADRTYLFTLLNRDGDDFVSEFDTMISTVRFTEGA